MKTLRQRCGFATVLMLLAGCYVEPSRDPEAEALKRQQNPSDQALSLHQDTGSCRVTTSKGCFDGHIAAKTGLNVEGKAFFNADDLATRFKELITVERDGKPLNDGRNREGHDDYELKLLSPLDNNGFISGFGYELVNGPTPKSGHLRSDGNISIDELTPGTYDLRVGKSVKFSVTPLAATPAAPVPVPPADGSKPDKALPTASAGDAAKPATKIYCATIYADQTVTIRAGQRLWQPLADFRLHVTDHECMNGAHQAVLSL